MIAALSHTVQQEVMFDHIPAAKAVVEVDPGPRPIEMHVSMQESLGADGLEVERALFLPDSDLADQVALDQRVPRLLSASPVRTDLVRSPLGAVLVEAFRRVAPRRDGAGSRSQELVVLDEGRVAEPVEREPHAVDVVDETLFEREQIRPFDADRSGPRQPPVASGGKPVRREVGGRRVCHLEAGELDALDWIGFVAFDREEFGELDGDEVHGSRPLVSGGIGLEVEVSFGLVEEPLAFAVDFLEDVFDPPLSAILDALSALVAGLRVEAQRPVTRVEPVHLKLPGQPPPSAAPRVDDCSRRVGVPLRSRPDDPVGGLVTDDAAWRLVGAPVAHRGCDVVAGSA
mmetsp:Transcript_27288/g.48220  ORF Transcript_27288/g.48220 Transcript_27288/m.48220 type:complete len:344 (+) Transcript_27288:793-1824(+)